MVDSWQVITEITGITTAIINAWLNIVPNGIKCLSDFLMSFGVFQRGEVPPPFLRKEKVIADNGLTKRQGECYLRGNHSLCAKQNQTDVYFNRLNVFRLRFRTVRASVGVDIA